MLATPFGSHKVSGVHIIRAVQQPRPGSSEVGIRHDAALQGSAARTQGPHAHTHGPAGILHLTSNHLIGVILIIIDRGINPKSLFDVLVVSCCY